MQKNKICLSFVLTAVLLLGGCGQGARNISSMEEGPQTSHLQGGENDLPDMEGFPYGIPQGVNFGMLETQVRQTEERKLLQEGAGEVAYDASEGENLGGLRADTLAYGFNSMEKLWVINYEMKAGEDVDPQLLTEEGYRGVLEELIKFLGQPLKEQEIWSEEVSSNPGTKDEGLADGSLTMGVQWQFGSVRAIFVFGTEQICLQYQDTSFRDK